MKEFAFGIVICAFLMNFQHETNYQLVSIGNGQAAVIDTRSGEVWMSEPNSYKFNIPDFRPREYAFSQVNERATYEGCPDHFYTPEKMRNKENCSWDEWFKRKFKS